MAIQDSGSNYQFYDKKIEPNIKRSSFKLDYLNNMTCSQGLLIPYRLVHTMPNSEYNLELESLLRAINIPKVLLQSRQRVFFHEYHVSYQQLWPQWSTFMSKGVSGKTVLPLPKIRFTFSGNSVHYILLTGLLDGTIYNSSTLTAADSPSFRNKILNYHGLGFGSLSEYLGFPCPGIALDSLDTIISNLKSDFDFYDGDYKTNYIFVDFPAFPFFAYASIFRNFYLNWNLNTTDKTYFPDNINDFALINPDVEDSNVFYANIRASNIASHYENNTTSSSYSIPCSIGFGFIKNRNFVDDYFTSALPWPMRGNVPEVSLDGIANLGDVPVGFKINPVASNSDFYPLNITLSGNQAKNRFSTVVNDLNLLTPGSNTSSQIIVSGLWNFDGGSAQDTRYNYVDGSLYARNTADLTFTSGLTWEMIRNLSISTMIAEKMARTNGSYKEFIRTFFDDTPSNQINNVPRYIGGHVQPIVYTEVLQQSADSNTPLGTVGAKGITASDGYIGKCYSNDFGVIIGVLSIMPDTYYSQGLRRQDLYEVQEDFYLPERAELGMQGIYKCELYLSGDESIDKDLFGYQNRYDEWRYRPNEVHGQLANPESTSFFPFTQSRYFTSSPVLSNEFVSTKNNIRRDYLTAIDEVDFVAQIACRCTAVQPLPYRAIPVGLK